MKLGDVIESAIWLNGDETKLQRMHYECDVREAIASLCCDEGWLHGPVTFTEKRPGEDLVPEVPDHIQGQCVRLLVAEAEIVGRKPESKPDSFVANLDRKDRARLRKLTRKAHAKVWGGRLNDRECDEIIEGCGPEAVLTVLRGENLLH